MPAARKVKGTIRKSVRKAKRLKRHSAAEREKILAEAKAAMLTGKQVAEKYGISTVTYYLWRKKEGAASMPGRRARAKSSPSGDGSTGEMRSIIKERVRSLAPSILRDEVMAYLAESVGTRAERRGKRK
jgi:transposase-like protein